MRDGKAFGTNQNRARKTYQNIIKVNESISMDKIQLYTRCKVLIHQLIVPLILN